MTIATVGRRMKKWAMTATPSGVADGASRRGLAGVSGASRLARRVGLTVMPCRTFCSPSTITWSVGLRPFSMTQSVPTRTPVLTCACLDRLVGLTTATAVHRVQGRHRFLRHEERAGSGVDDDARAPELARPDQLVGVGKGDLDQKRAGRRVHRPVGERQPSAVGCSEPSARIISTSRLDRSAARLTPIFRRSAGNFEIVALADADARGGSGRPSRSCVSSVALPAAHQVPFVDFGLADEAVGRRVDLRVAHVELGRVDRRLRGLDAGAPGVDLRDRRLERLPRHGVLLDERRCTARRPARSARDRPRPAPACPSPAAPRR